LREFVPNQSPPADVPNFPIADQIVRRTVGASEMGVHCFAVFEVKNEILAHRCFRESMGLLEKRTLDL
jgi:hypothetical protein